MPKPNSTAQKLNHIQQGLGVSVAVLSKILHTSRRQLYTWFDGKSPEAAGIQHIEKIFQIAKAFREANALERPVGNTIRQPLSNGASWLELLTRPEIDVKATIKRIPEVLELMEEARKNHRLKPNIALSEGERAQRRAIMDTLTGVAPADDG